jgi:flagellar protein FlaJ
MSDEEESDSIEEDKKTRFTGQAISQLSKTIKEDTSRGFPDTKIGKYLDRVFYSIFGSLFRGKEDQYAGFERKLNQARITVSYDIYLSRLMAYSILSSILGLLIGFLTSNIFSKQLSSLSLGLNLPPGVSSFVDQNTLILSIIVITILAGIIMFIIVFMIFYYYPFYIANERKRQINLLLPHAITFMYAMSKGGMNVLGVLRTLSESNDVYDEVSREAEAVINNVDIVKQDLRTAIREESTITPSSNMREFFEDLLNVIDTGSNMEQFFLNKSQIYLDRAKKEQENLLETLEIMSEVYVTLFVVSPVFLTVVLVVMSLLGNSEQNVTYLYGLTYFGVPFGGAMFGLIIKLISESSSVEIKKISHKDSHIDNLINSGVREEDVKSDTRYQSYARNKRIARYKRKIKNIIPTLIEKPSYSLLPTSIISVSWIAWSHFSELAVISPDAFIARPVWNTLILAYIPLLITIGIYSVLFEIKNRRKSKILKRLPELFKSAADANDRGLSIEEAFEVVSQNSRGNLAKQLRKAVNQANWTGDLTGSLINFSNEIKVTRLSRTVKLITKANEVSGDIQSVLNVAAKDVSDMHELEQKRKQNATIYLLIVFVSFVISVMIIAMLDVYFLESIEESEAFSGGSSSLSRSGVGIGGGFPVEKFRLSFVHTTFLLGGASGIVSGIMANNKASTGLKYSLIMMGISLLVFGLF